MEQVYETRDGRCIMEEKFELVKVADNVYKGKYPLEPYADGARGTYGGEFISQSVLAAWETIDSPDLSLHSLHSYFLKAGSNESVMRYEVETNSQGKSFTNKLVKVFQEHTNELVFMLVCSFTGKNSIYQRKLEFSKSESNRVPLEFGTTPGPLFWKYRKQVKKGGDGLLQMNHTHDLVVHMLPPNFLKPPKKGEYTNEVGDRRLGLFTKITDELPTDAQKVNKIKVSNLLYLSDSLYLGLMSRILGIPVSPKNSDFFRVSLDHSVFIHDIDFNPNEYLYLDYRFPRLSNSRILCECAFYDLDGKQIATVTQEALVDIPKAWLGKTYGGSYKL